MKGAWSHLNFHILVKTLFLLTRVLFRVLCSGVSISVVGLCVNLMETVMQLVVLVAAGVVAPRCVRLVRIVIFVVLFSHVGAVLAISMVPVG